MPDKSAFLALVLPKLGEFLDSWNQPVNQNFEAIDDYLSKVSVALSDTSTANPPAVMATLAGSKPSLAQRLNISLNADGTIKLEGSPAIMALASSATSGDFANLRDRFEYPEIETWKARSPLYGDRFLVVPTGKGLLDVGMAHRARDLGAYDAAHPIASPPRPFLAGMVQGGDLSIIGVAGVNHAKFDATIGSPSSWLLYNIDGFVFRIRQATILDCTVAADGTALVDGDIVYIFVERDSTKYGNANSKFKLSTNGGATATKDLRILQSGSDGVISGKTLSTVSAAFTGSTTKWQVMPGDLLVIESGAAAGSYVIDTVPSPTSCTIKGKFRADALSNQAWHVQDDAHPNIGCIKVADITAEPPYAAGRTYIGRAELNANGLRPVSGGAMTKIAFPSSGVYDSGWLGDQAPITTGASFPLTIEHNLGVLPLELEIWVRAGASTEVYRPVVLRSIVVDAVDANADTIVNYAELKKATLPFPSFLVQSTRQQTIIRLSSGANAAAALFTDKNDVDVTSGQLRLIARR